MKLQRPVFVDPSLQHGDDDKRGRYTFPFERHSHPRAQAIAAPDGGQGVLGAQADQTADHGQRRHCRLQLHHAWPTPSRFTFSSSLKSPAGLSLSLANYDELSGVLSSLFCFFLCLRCRPCRTLKEVLDGSVSPPLRRRRQWRRR